MSTKNVPHEKALPDLCYFIIAFENMGATTTGEAFQGCGAATVVAYPPSGLSAITYSLQRQTRITWTTVLETIRNWGTLIPGDVIVCEPDSNPVRLIYLPVAE